MKQDVQVGKCKLCTPRVLVGGGPLKVQLQVRHVQEQEHHRHERPEVIPPQTTCTGPIPKTEESQKAGECAQHNVRH